MSAGRGTLGAAVALAAVLSALLARPAQPQAVSFSVTAGGGERVRNTLIFQGVREETAGPWFGEWPNSGWVPWCWVVAGA